MRPGTEDRALKAGGQKAAAEVFQAARGNEAAVQNDKAGKVLAFAAQPVANPRSHTGPARKSKTSMEKIIGAGVLGKIRSHGTNNAQIVNAPGNLREKLAH